VPFAAFALMRTILEIVLKDHYGAAGADLIELIKSAATLPKSVSRDQLHRIRLLGNDVLHFKKQYLNDRKKSDVANIEREIITLFIVLKSLIEQAPDLRTS
jgi:uncharacterized protein DUF4145